VSSPNLVAPPGRAAAKRSGVSVALVAIGFVLDVAALPNVPGASTFDAAGEITTTDLGSTLVLVILGAWITVIWRRRVPLLVLVAGAVLAVIGISYVLLLVGALATGHRHPHRVGRLAAFTATSVGLFVVREVTTAWGGALPWYFTSRAEAQFEPAWALASIVWAVLSLGVVTVLALLSRTRARAEQSAVRADREHRRADALTEQMVRQAERERIARDMHDALAHRLSVVSLHAGALETASQASAADGEAAGRIARTVREQTHAALQDMRALIGDLRSSGQVGHASPASMRAIGAMLADLRATGTDVRPYVVIESAERASALLDGAVFRVVQEGLTNAVKHAPRMPIDVFVSVEPRSGARIRISNPLVPQAVSAVPGGANGLIGIRERAAALGGEAWLGAHEGAFIVDVTLPWQERG